LEEQRQKVDDLVSQLQEKQEEEQRRLNELKQHRLSQLAEVNLIESYLFSCKQADASLTLDSDSTRRWLESIPLCLRLPPMMNKL
jgi:hypothetical protein